LCQLLPAPQDAEPHAEVRFDLALRRLAGWSERRVHEGALAAGPHGRDPAPREAPRVGLALVGARVAMVPAHVRTGVLALIGPSRLDYETAIPLVEYAARAVATRP
jgi:hypothetical protein